MTSSRPTPRREKTSKAGAADPSRRRCCSFCRERTDEVDFKDFSALRRLMSEKGKIRSSRITGTCRRHQNQVAVAIKRAREMALLPNASR